MKQRLLVAALGVPALLAVLLVCPWWATMVMMCLISGAAAYELLHTACKDVPKMVYVLTILSAILQVIFRATGCDLYAIGTISSGTVISWLFLMLLFLVAVLRYGKANALKFSDLAVAVIGGIAMPMLYCCVALVRKDEAFGKVYVLAPFVIAFIGDSFSMFAGMIFGGRKMAPHVSPKKTVAGGIGGPVGSALGMAALGLVGTALWSYTPNYLALVALGVVANLFGQLGDLSMSLIKREAGIKDYSHIFLTHGGMLDRFDSTMFIAPVVYFFVLGGML